MKKETVSIKEDEPVKGTNTSDYSFTITSFDPALYYIPSMNVKVGGKVYSTNQLAIKVNDVKVDTAHVDKFFGPKEIIEPVYTWRDWMPLFFLSLLLIVCGLTIWIAARKLIAAPKIKVAKAAKKEQLLPHKEAQNEIAKLKNEYESEELSSKDYYTSLILILRKYVSKRYGFRADEMTSYELVEHLIDLGDRQKLMAKENADKRTGLHGIARNSCYCRPYKICKTQNRFKRRRTQSNASVILHRNHQKRQNSSCSRGRRRQQTRNSRTKPTHQKESCSRHSHYCFRDSGSFNNQRDFRIVAIVLYANDNIRK